MQAATKELVRQLHIKYPIIHGISCDLIFKGMTNIPTEKWYLHIWNNYIPFDTEAELRAELKRLLNVDMDMFQLAIKETMNKVVKK